MTDNPNSWADAVEDAQQQRWESAVEELVDAEQAGVLGKPRDGLEPREAQTDAFEASQAALDAEFAKAIDPDKPDPGGDLEPETSQPAEYPEEQNGAATKPVGSDHITVQIGKIPGLSEEAQGQWAEINDLLSGKTDADTTAEVGTPKEYPPDTPDPLGIAAAGVTAGAAGARNYLDRRSTKDDSDQAATEYPGYDDRPRS
jgi:hypothetical protein